MQPFPTVTVWRPQRALPSAMATVPYGSPCINRESR